MNTYPSEQRSCESLEDVILRRPTTACRSGRPPTVQSHLMRRFSELNWPIAKQQQYIRYMSRFRKRPVSPIKTLHYKRIHHRPGGSVDQHQLILLPAPASCKLDSLICFSRFQELDTSHPAILIITGQDGLEVFL